MKFKKAEIEKKLEEALNKANVQENFRERIVDAFRLLQQSHFPVFDCLEFEEVLPDNKANPLRIKFSSYIVGGNSDICYITFTVTPESITITDDSNYIELELSDKQRIATFKYDNDIIRVSGTWEAFVGHDGGFNVIDLKLYTDAWNGVEGLDLSYIEPDFKKVISQCCGTFEVDFLEPSGSRYINVDTLKLLDPYLALGIYYRNYNYRKSLDIFADVTKTK